MKNINIGYVISIISVCIIVSLVGECLYYLKDNLVIPKDWFLKELLSSFIFSIVVGGVIIISQQYLIKKRNKQNQETE